MFQWRTANEQVVGETTNKNMQNPKRKTNNQIDYITANNTFRNAGLHCKTYFSADCGSGHLPLICKHRIKVRKLRSLQYDRLLKESNVKEKYMDSNMDRKVDMRGKMVNENSRPIKGSFSNVSNRHNLKR